MNTSTLANGVMLFILLSMPFLTAMNRLEMRGRLSSISSLIIMVAGILPIAMIFIMVAGLPIGSIWLMAGTAIFQMVFFITIIYSLSAAKDDKPANKPSNLLGKIKWHLGRIDKAFQKRDNKDGK